jgi:ketosteroid isomerase-like protein
MRPDVHVRPITRSALICVLLVSSLFTKTTSAEGQESRTGDALIGTIAGLDTALFTAFNACDLKALGNMVTDDLEFFHDIDGLSVGKQTFLDSVRQNVCGKMRRDLVPGTLEVYPLGGYGALEIGVHRFHHPGRDDTEPVGEARFVIIWKQNGTAWKMARTISYGHGALPK